MPRPLPMSVASSATTQWENLILGVELNYNHTNVSQSSASSLGRAFSDSGGLPPGHNYFYDVTVGGGASVHVSDIATFRAAPGSRNSNFLPYAFAGLALAHASTSTFATLQYTATDFPDFATPPLTPLNPLSFGPVSSTNTQNNALAYGVTAGLGLDIGLLQNVFLRGELEYIYLAPIDVSRCHIVGALGLGPEILKIILKVWQSLRSFSYAALDDTRPVP